MTTENFIWQLSKSSMLTFAHGTLCCLGKVPCLWGPRFGITCLLKLQCYNLMPSTRLCKRILCKRVLSNHNACLAKYDRRYLELSACFRFAASEYAIRGHPPHPLFDCPLTFLANAVC